MNKALLRFIPLAACLFSTAALFAQTCPTGPGGPGSAPIDGGVSALLVGAGILGYKHLRKDKQNTDRKED